jgi:hypothetical protein
MTLRQGYFPDIQPTIHYVPNPKSSVLLLANLPVLIPLNQVLNDPPLERRQSDLTSPDIQWYPQENDCP